MGGQLGVKKSIEQSYQLGVHTHTPVLAPFRICII